VRYSRAGRNPDNATSDYPEMAEYLVEIGIDSMSLTPDTVLETTRHVL
jgi:pyruvate,water dikinase